MDPITRRRFLKALGAGGVACALARTPGTVWAQAAGVAGFSDYRSLVCVFLFGGNDSWSMFVPRSDAEYAVYAATRQNLAIPQAALLPLNATNGNGVQYGMHPSMPGLASLFESSRCAVMANVGPLIRPTTKADYLAGSADLPPQLFSHNDQQDQWHSLKGKAVSRSGWAGRMADALAGQASGEIAINVSLAGNTLFQAGEVATPYVMGPAGPVTFDGLGSSGLDPARRAAFERILAASQETVYGRAYADVQKRALAYAQLVNDALAAAPPIATPFPADSSLAMQLMTVARMIAVREQLGMTRQVFFVAIGGFDTHDFQLDQQPGLLADVSASLTAFHAATVELGVASSVTTFTQSDFGRTLTSNGDGSDHAWGGVQLVIGDAVRGRTIYGEYPLLELDGPQDVGAGRMIPVVSSDQYAATLAKWFGIGDMAMPTIAPSIGNFAERDLGFMI
ncbi:MAG: DUF1501 domain-containing protein [Steroidobacteraceae bacterium]